MTIYISIKNKDNKLCCKIVKNRIIELYIHPKLSDDILNYGIALLDSLKMVENNSEVVLFTDNIYVTNMINEWLEKIDQVNLSYDVWKSIKKIRKENQLNISSFTIY